MTRHRGQSNFATSDLHGHLARRTVRGGVVTIAAQGARTGIQLGSTIILARLLTPEDYGLIAMVTVFTGFIALFKDLGLSAATVQKEEINHRQVTALFWTNVLASVLLALATCALAPVVSRFYGEPRLTAVTVSLGSTFILAGLGAQHIALLRRRMRYRELATIDIGAALAGFLLALALALHGAGYWALVASIAGTAFTSTLLAAIKTSWLPGPPRREPDVMPMLKFGFNLTGFNILNYLRRNADNLLLGVAAGAGPLGFYTRSYHLALMPVHQINGPLSAVLVPALSRLQKAPEEFRSYFCNGTRMVMYGLIPLLAFMFVLSEEIILSALGARWSASIEIFRALTPFALMQVIAASTGWMLVSLGQAGRMLRWQLFQAPYMIAAFALGLQWGATGVAVAATSATAVSIVPYLVFAFRLSPVSLGDFARALVRPAQLAAVVALTAWLARSATPGQGSATTLLVSTVITAIVAVAAVIAWNPLRTDLRKAFEHVRPDRGPETH